MAIVKLGDVAREYKETLKDVEGLPIVGLEHLTPGEIELENWDEGKDNTFTKGFKQGHVLFGRRRAYLKKAALAPFRGVCSGDITVIEAIPQKILPELLPFIIQNDALFDYAVGQSAGSLSPRVKWEQLKNYEFSLPELPEQNILLELLQSAYDTKRAYQKLIVQTDELVKSQFIEMFGGEGRERKPLIECSKRVTDYVASGSFASLKENVKMSKDEDYALMVKTADFANGFTKDLTYTDKHGYDFLRNSNLYGGELILSNIGSIGKVFIVPKIEKPMTLASNAILVEPSDEFDVGYLYHYFTGIDGQSALFSLASGTTLMKFNKTQLKTVPIPVATKDEQKRFMALAEQSDKSKFELQQAIENINQLIRSLIEGNYEAKEEA